MNLKHRLKATLILLFLLPTLSFAQSCDTLYSHGKHIQRNIEIEYRNCYLLNIDTVYTIVQWQNIDTNYLTPFYSENRCYSIFHSRTGKLIQECWEDADSTFVHTYHASGKIKRAYSQANSPDPSFFHVFIKEYYENGNIRYEGQYKSLSYTTHTTYYPDGAVESIAKRFSFNPSAFGEYVEYFPNGQISSIQVSTEPDTTTNEFQVNTILSTRYFDESGKEVNESLNEFIRMNLKIYPPDEGSKIEMIGDNLYLFELFSDQEAYADGMSALKTQINSNLDYSKTERCNQGIAWISLIVSKKGVLKLKEIEFENAKMRKQIEKSIRKIKRWPAAQLTGKNVDTYVHIYLILEK